MIPRFLFKHDRIGKPVPTFPDRALRRAGIIGVHPVHPLCRERQQQFQHPVYGEDLRFKAQLIVRETVYSTLLGRRVLTTTICKRVAVTRQHPFNHRLLRKMQKDSFAQRLCPRLRGGGILECALDCIRHRAHDIGRE